MIFNFEITARFSLNSLFNEKIGSSNNICKYGVRQGNPTYRLPVFLTELAGLITDPDADYPEVLLWFSSVSSGRCQGIACTLMGPPLSSPHSSYFTMYL
jgi:hypothetical protein